MSARVGFTVSVLAAVVTTLAAVSTWLVGEPVSAFLGGVLFALLAGFNVYHAALWRDQL